MTVTAGKVRGPLAGPRGQAARPCIQRVVCCIPAHPPACSTTKGSTVCGCTLPYLACFIAVPVAAMAVASGMWHAAGRAARVTTDGQVTSTSTWLFNASQLGFYIPPVVVLVAIYSILNGGRSLRAEKYN